MLHNFPDEVILMIFQNLKFKDLINVSEVSKRFQKLGTDPSLWEDYDLSRRSLCEKVALISLPRFQNLKSFECSSCKKMEFSSQDMNIFLEVMLKMSFVNVCFSGFFPWRRINDDLVADVITKTKRVKISPESEEDIGPDQLRKIFEKIPGGNIKELHLKKVHLNLNPDLAAKAVNSLEKFDYSLCSHHPSVIQEIFVEMSDSTKLRSLTCEFRKTFSVDHIQPDILARALNNLESLKFENDSYVCLNLKVWELLFHGIANGQTMLQKIILNPASTNGLPLIKLFPSMPPSVLGKAINRLDTFIAPKLKFSTDQLVSILSGMKMESSKLQKIHLGKGQLSTDSVTMDTLKGVLNQINDNDLKMFANLFNLGTNVFFSELTTDQSHINVKLENKP